MRTRDLGDVFDTIFASIGDIDMSAIVYDMETGRIFDATQVREVYQMDKMVYLTDNWHSVEGHRNVWKIGRLYADPIIVTSITEPKVLDTISETTARIGEHEFNVLDMEWTCQCGTVMEPDAEECGECDAENPFLGVLV